MEGIQARDITEEGDTRNMFELWLAYGRARSLHGGGI